MGKMIAIAWACKLEMGGTLNNIMGRPQVYPKTSHAYLHICSWFFSKMCILCTESFLESHCASYHALD